MPTTSAFTVCALCYGDYPDLARWLLGSLERSCPGNRLGDLRIGLNAVSQATEDLVFRFAREAPWPVTVYQPEHNVGKYPLMRRMLYDPVQCQPRVMWFDDDSFLDPTCGRDWWDGVAEESMLPTVLGRIHLIRQRDQQYLGIPQQPWFAGLAVPKNHTFRFVTGGWWIADSAFLRQHNYPFPELHHNGGDSILGELVRQQGGKLAQSRYAKCHCESCLRRPGADTCQVHVNVGGRKGRRGLGLHDEVYPWQNYQPGKDPDYEHHNFNCKIARWS